MKARWFFAVLVLTSGATSLHAGRTNDPVTAAAAGKELVRQLLALRPESSFTNHGKLLIRLSRKERWETAYTCRVTVTETNWTSHYSAVRGTNALPGFSVEHRAGQPAIYRDDRGDVLTGDELNRPFAESDFWRLDLGLEFFHWPDQRVLKWEMKRSCGCKVLESRHPNPEAGGYSRVVSWIHEESLGIVQAEAYDIRGKLLKEFRPTELEKVNGQRELKEMEIENVQRGSRTRLEFDLKS
jgi:hypothetical protein